MQGYGTSTAPYALFFIVCFFGGFFILFFTIFIYLMRQPAHIKSGSFVLNDGMPGS